MDVTAMTSNNTYFSTILAAFKARPSVYQSVSSSAASVSHTVSSALPIPGARPNHRSFSPSPSPHHNHHGRRRSSVSPCDSRGSPLSPSPFDHHLSDPSEWVAPSPQAISRFRPKQLPRSVLRQSSPDGSVPFASPTATQATAASNIANSNITHPPMKRQLSHSPPSRTSDIAYSPPPHTNHPSNVRYHVTQQSAVVRPAPSLSSNNRSRRGSDSSNEGFRDIGPEKWYIAGTNSNGDERFYRLGVVKRPRSSDRLSLDQMSI